MKKIIRLASLALVCIMLVSCGNTAHTTVTTENTSSQSSTQIPFPSENNSSYPIYIQAINFGRDFNEAKKFIETNDLSDTSIYYEYLFSRKKQEARMAIDRSNIQKMIDAFRGDGYITRVTAEGADKVEFRFLGPYLENVRVMPHIAHYVKKGDYSCYFEIRFADPNVLEIVEGREDFEKAYLIERYGEYSLFDENCQVVDYTGNNLGSAKKLYISTTGNVYFWLDNTHLVFASPTENNKDIATFVEFAKTLTFEKVPLEK